MTTHTYHLFAYTHIDTYTDIHTLYIHCTYMPVHQCITDNTD